MLDRFVLLRLKCRLWRYKRKARYYISIRVTMNWYVTKGIPDLVGEITELEAKIRGKR